MARHYSWEDDVLPRMPIPTLPEELKRLNDSFSSDFDSDAACSISYEEYKHKAASELKGDQLYWASPELRAWMKENYPTKPESPLSSIAQENLTAALGCLVQAEQAASEGAHEQAWFHISQAKEYRGMAQGFDDGLRERAFREKRASEGGHQKSEQQHLYLAKAAAVFLLLEAGKTPGWKSTDSAVKLILGDLLAFRERAQLTLDITESRVQRWLEEDPMLKLVYKQGKLPSKKKLKEMRAARPS